MDELVGRLVAKVGVDRAAAEMADGVVSRFFANARPADRARARADRFLAPAVTNSLAFATTDGTRGAFGVVASGNPVMTAAPCWSAAMAVTRKPNGDERKQAKKNAAGPMVGALPSLTANI